MNILIKQVVLLEPSSKHHMQVVDLMIVDGVIVEIAKQIEPKNNCTLWQGENLHVSAGWFDMRANFKDPGVEYMEDIYSGVNAAMQGGFTGVCLSPETEPAIDNKAQVLYITQKAASLLVDIVPNGSLSKQLLGKELAEMYDMHLAGARGFYNGKNTEVSSALMQKALLYARHMNEVVINYPLDRSISGAGQIHEGSTSTSLGLKGIPSIAEEIRLNRDIYLAEYTEGKLHAATISSAGSVSLIKAAKAKKTSVTCDVSALQLFFIDEDLSDFSTALKVSPPFRSKEDKLALIKGLKDNVIDVICSDHEPLDNDHKKVEFDFASYGCIGLETAFSVANTALAKQMKIDDIVAKICNNPRVILGIDAVKVEVGQVANLTVFDPTMEYTLELDHIKSKSKNTPLIGTKLVGKALGVINNNQANWLV
jgi:dihydroorotase